MSITKCCSRCKLTKPLEQFSKDQSRKSGLANQCKACRAALKLPARQHLKDYLSSHPCYDCGQKDFRLLSLDHRDPKAKFASVSRLTSYSLEKVKIEIDKCDVRCYHCHMLKTASELNWYKGLT